MPEKSSVDDLRTQLKQREAELAVINSVQRALSVKMNLNEIYELVGDQIRALFDPQVALGIYIFDHDAKMEHFGYLFEDGERVYPKSRPFTKIRLWIIENAKTLLVNENADEVILKTTGEEHKAVPGTRLPKSLLFVPLLVNNEVRGCVSLQDLDREHAFSDSDVQLLTTLVNGMGVALENARLFDETSRLLAETEQRNAELAVINSIQQGLVAQMDLQAIYDLVGNQIRDLFDAQVVAIATFDHENEREIFKFMFEDGKRYYPSPRPLDKIRSRLIKTRKPIHISEKSEEAYTTITGEAPVSVPGTKFAKSMIFVPLSIGDSVRGYVTLQNVDRDHAYSDSDVRLLITLANSMSVALENARLFNETEQRNAELAVINSVQHGLVAEMDMQGIYDLIGDRIRELFDAQVTAIVTFDHDKKKELFNYLFEDGDRLYPTARHFDKVREKLIAERKTLLFNENAAESLSNINGEPHKPVPGTRVAKSAVYVPMGVGETVRGYVTLQNLDREHAFSESDVRLLNTLTNSMSVALENARLFDETTRLLAETEQRNAELAVINSVQDGLVREMDMQAIYRLVGERICEVLHTQTMIIRTFDHESGLEHWRYAVEKGEIIEVEPRPLIWANKILLETKQFLLINEKYEEVAVQYDGTAITKGLAPKSAIFVPMIVSNVVVGSVSLQNVEIEHAFSDSDVRLITTLTNSMSVAIENARLFSETSRLLEETNQRATELDTVNRISNALVAQLEFDALIHLVGELMRETFHADIVYLALHDRVENMIHFPYYYGDESKSRPFGNGITEKIITGKKPILINENLDTAYQNLKADKRGKTVSSFLGVPILVGDTSIGVISVQSTELENVFDDDDLRLLSTIAANVGVAIQNADSYKKLRTALDDLKAVQEQLIQQEKLASLGQLTAGIAHEIKNPLNFVNNFSSVSIEMLEEAREELREEVKERRNEEVKERRSEGEKGEGSEGAKEGIEDGRLTLVFEILDDIESNLTKIHEHGTRADGIVKSMLMHSRGGSGKKEATDFNAVVKEYVNLAYHGMRASKQQINVNVDVSVDDKVGSIPIITEDFSRVILNLCNNAFDAMRDKIQTDGKSYSPELLVRTIKKDGCILVEIEDNGPGISGEIRDKILQPFFTTKKGTQGTGLGLSITHDIIKAHGGTLAIDSVPGKTLFRIQLPVS